MQYVQCSGPHELLIRFQVYQVYCIMLPIVYIVSAALMAFYNSTGTVPNLQVCTKRMYYDFIVWLNNDIHIERIYPDDGFMTCCSKGYVYRGMTCNPWLGVLSLYCQGKIGPSKYGLGTL